MLSVVVSWMLPLLLRLKCSVYMMSLYDLLVSGNNFPQSHRLCPCSDLEALVWLHGRDPADEQATLTAAADDMHLLYHFHVVNWLRKCTGLTHYSKT